MANIRISLDEWLDIAETLFGEVIERFSDDGKISLADAIALAFSFVRLINKAAKSN